MELEYERSVEETREAVEFFPTSILEHVEYSGRFPRRNFMYHTSVSVSVFEFY